MHPAVLHRAAIATHHTKLQSHYHAGAPYYTATTIATYLPTCVTLNYITATKHLCHTAQLPPCILPYYTMQPSPCNILSHTATTIQLYYTVLYSTATTVYTAQSSPCITMNHTALSALYYPIITRLPNQHCTARSSPYRPISIILPYQHFTI